MLTSDILMLTSPLRKLVDRALKRQSNDILSVYLFIHFHIINVHISWKAINDNPRSGLSRYISDC